MTQTGSDLGLWRSIRLLLVGLVISLAPPVLASTAPWQQLRTVGQGEMN